MISWNLLTELFWQTLELPEGQREDFLLAHFQQDPESLKQIREMLQLHQQAENYFENLQRDLANELLEPSNESPCEPGQKLGAFTIQEEIGRGGMAVVYAANRSDGQFQHEVAIKVIKKGLHTEESLQRFKYERQLLARLNHPNIARLFDGGTTEQGLPYFVMEKVSGMSLEELLTQKTMPKAERWAWIEKIVQTVNYAHRNLIVHGDLKPSNIWIDQEGAIKLLDFGIATLTEEDGRAQSAAFTPDYGSPEHWSRQTLLPASDVFQLGLIISKFFTGENPQKKFAPNGHWNQETLDDTLKWLKSQSLGKEERAIIGRCLFVEASDRYENAQALWEDLRALFQNRPLKALEPTLPYILSKYAQRNKIAIIAYSFSLLTLICISVLYVIDINHKKQEADRQRNKAEQFSQFLIELFSGADPYSSIGQENAKDLTLRDFITQKRKSLSSDTLIAPDFKFKLLLMLSEVYFNIGEEEEGIKSLNEQEIFTQKEFGNYSNEMATIWLKRAKQYTYRALYDSSTLAYQKALTLMDGLPSPDQYLKATILNNLGLNYHYEGRFEEAEKMYLEAREIFEAYPELDQEVLTNHNNYAQLLRMTGRYQEAFSLSERVLAGQLEKVHGDSANLYVIQKLSDHSLVAMELGKYELAKTLTQKVISEYTKKLGADHYNTMITQQNYATILLLNKEYEEAGSLIKTMLEQTKTSQGIHSYDYLYLVHLYAEFALITHQAGLAKAYLNDALISSDQLFTSANSLKSLLYLDAALMNWMIDDNTLAQEQWAYAFESLSQILPENHYRIFFMKAIQQVVSQEITPNYLDSLSASKANVDRYLIILEHLKTRN